MDINDDLITFYEWAILMGVPPGLVPSFQVMHTTLRARSLIVMDMVHKVRPLQEVQLMRDNILILRMRKLKDKDLPMSVRSFIPERYHRYETMRDANRKIKETTEKLDRIKLQSNKILEKIKNLNITKAKIQKFREDSLAKRKLLEAKLLTLAVEIEKVKEQDKMLKHNAIICPDALNMDEDRALMALTKAKSELENFYKNYSVNCHDIESKSEAKTQLFEAIRCAVQNQPNLILYRTMHKSITNELECLLQPDLSSRSLNKSANVEESIARNISDAYQRFILRSTQLDAEREALNTITDNYEHLYTDMNEALADKLPDSLKEHRDQFIQESSHLYLNEGRIQFLHSEIARNKELLRERSEKMRDMMESQETVKEMVRKSQAGLAAMVSDMKQMQKISVQLCHLRDLTEKHLELMKGDFKPATKITSASCGAGSLGKKYSICVPDDVKGFSLVDELKLLGDIPMSYLYTLDPGQLFRRNSPIYMYKPDMIRASRSAHLYTVPGFLREVKDVCNLHMYLGTINRKREFTMAHIPVDIDDIRKKEYEQNKSIFRLMQFVEQQFVKTEELVDKAKIYYNFLMTTPLKNYIPPCMKVDGKSFIQMENEFLLYYRMVRGVEKAHEEM